MAKLCESFVFKKVCHWKKRRSAPGSVATEPVPAALSRIGHCGPAAAGKTKDITGRVEQPIGVGKAIHHTLERGQVTGATLTQIVRLAMSFEYSVGEFVEEVLKKEQELTSE